MPGQPSSSRSSGFWHSTMTCPMLLDQRRIANELDRVAQPLLGMQQDGFSFQRPSVPERLRNSVAARMLPSAIAIRIPANLAANRP